MTVVPDMLVMKDGYRICPQDKEEERGIVATPSRHLRAFLLGPRRISLHSLAREGGWPKYVRGSSRCTCGGLLVCTASVQQLAMMMMATQDFRSSGMLDK
jgi:hypothetical protein